MFDPPPPGVGDELGFVSRADSEAGRWPDGVLQRVRAELAAGGGVLALGQTDPIGPQSLNHSLGLQLAAQSARRLATELGAEATRFAAASRGEVADQTPGVRLHAWRPPASQRGPVGRLAVLEPLPGVAGRGRFWGVWQGDSERVLWAHGGEESPLLWEVPPHDRVLRLAVPSRAAVAALAGNLSGGAREAQQVEVPAPREDPALRLRLAAVEPGWVRARVHVPEGYRQPLVWAGGIPYRLVPDIGGEAEVALARVGADTRAYVQALGPRGDAVVGPPLHLPDDGALLADFVVVLVWSGDGVDLDLHAWDGSHHTHQGSPDAAYSDAAVSGVRLLFDGDAWQPASAVAGWGRRPPELSAQCYSDLGRSGAVAWFYVVDYPEDPLRESRRILGPRRLSEIPTEARWPVLRPAAVAAR
ncbi:MAG: hypothetical protein P1P84_02380 [Deferrisomatales bacterium]|nr:hypothetical protein [Deferrisomatales bacterium]